VFSQVFVDREYRCLDDVSSVGLIVDCGANVGYSAAYLLTRFPDAHLVAIEPDPSNFAVLRKNMEPYGHRCTLVEAGVWSTQTDLVVVEQPVGAGREWAIKVREAFPNEAATVSAVDIGSVLQGSGFSSISILKIDIEGSEAEVFASNTHSWLGCVDNIVIELHGTACEKAFFDATEHSGFEISTCDELTVAKTPVHK
jgi:FkbM family methyltransferase